MAAESDLLGVMVIAAWAVHSETAKGMEYSASRYLAYLMRNPRKVPVTLVYQALSATFLATPSQFCIPCAARTPVAKHAVSK